MDAFILCACRVKYMSRTPSCVCAGNVCKLRGCVHEGDAVVNSVSNPVYYTCTPLETSSVGAPGLTGGLVLVATPQLWVHLVSLPRPCGLCIAIFPLL